MPPGAIYVGRPTVWGNPWQVSNIMTAKDAVEAFRLWIGWNPVYLEMVEARLAGHDLVCWCRLNQPCHADVLLEIANRLNNH
jgi:hypothetical protein